MPNGKAIPIEFKIDENVLRNAKALGRLQGVFFMLLLSKVCKIIVRHEEKKTVGENEES